jgi:hypothetical protein
MVIAVMTAVMIAVTDCIGGCMDNVYTCVGQLCGRLQRQQGHECWGCAYIPQKRTQSARIASLGDAAGCL